MMRRLFLRDDGQPLSDKEAETLQMMTLALSGWPKLAAALAFANTKIAKSALYIIGVLLASWLGLPQQGIAALAKFF